MVFGDQWIDREGKTPLIVACMNPGLSNVAKTLIELGANVNAYRPGIVPLLMYRNSALLYVELCVMLLKCENVV